MTYSISACSVREDPSRLEAIQLAPSGEGFDKIVDILRRDRVALVKNVAPAQADEVIQGVANRLALADKLELQAGFASIAGHRSNSGRFFMTVNERSDYQFISPHSEGTSFMGMQLASFYCYENTTDGGESILMNVNGTAPVWSRLRESSWRARVTRQLTRQELARARVQYQIRLPDDLLKPEDQVFKEIRTEIPGLTVLGVLVPVRTSVCQILGRNLHVYWDSVSSIDGSCGEQYAEILKQSGMLRVPPEGMLLEKLDNAYPRRLWASKTEFADIFGCKISYKMVPGDVIIQNNMTWTHSAANWTPGSGVRRIVAAFA